MGTYTTITITGPREDLAKLKLHKLPLFEMHDHYEWDARPTSEPDGEYEVWTAGNSKWSLEGPGAWAVKFTTKRPTLRVEIHEEWDNRDADEPGEEVDVYEGGDYIRAESKMNGLVPIDIRMLVDEGRAALEARDEAASHQPGLSLEHLDRITAALRALVAGLS